LIEFSVRFLNKHSFMKKILYFVYLVVFVFVFAEITLRVTKSGQPGIFQQYDQFEIVDSLYELKNYTTDEYGIYKFSSWVADSVPFYFDENQSDLFGNYYNHISNNTILNLIDWGTDHVNEIFTEYKKLEFNLKKDRGFEPMGEFEKFVYQTFHKDSKTAFDSAILNYIEKPFNEEGFRSISFNSKDTSKIKVLLIGDSFTYGQTAKPFYNSFADVLLSRGYLVFNAGISGTDPAQYAAVAKKYVPLLKPDIVIINFCINNDFMSFDREPHQERPHEYLTNAGFFYSAPYGEFMQLQDVYDFYLKLSSIPNVESNLINLFISKFIVTTKIWGLMYNIRLVKHPILDTYLEKLNPSNDVRTAQTQKYLDLIMEVSESNVTPTEIVLIPDIAYQPKDFQTLVIYDSLVFDVFEKYKYFFPNNFIESDYAKDGDIHFNNQGHLKYADFLEKSIINEIYYK